MCFRGCCVSDTLTVWTIHNDCASTKRKYRRQRIEVTGGAGLPFFFLSLLFFLLFYRRCVFSSFSDTFFLFFWYSEWISVREYVLCVGLTVDDVPYSFCCAIFVCLLSFVCAVRMDIVHLHDTTPSTASDDSINFKWFLACAQIYKQPTTNWDRWASRIPIPNCWRRAMFTFIARPSSHRMHRHRTTIGHWRHGVMITTKWLTWFWYVGFVQLCARACGRCHYICERGESVNVLVS